MNLPKVLFHLNNWLYHSVMVGWYSLVEKYFDGWIWFHRTRRDYYLNKIEKNDARIAELESELERRAKVRAALSK